MFRSFPLPRLVKPASLLLIGGLLAVFYRELVGFESIAPILASNEGAVDGYMFMPNEKSPALIFGLAAFFFAGRLRELRAVLGTGTATPGLVLLVPGLALGIWAHYTGELPLLVISLSLTLLGGAGVLGGRSALRRMRLPALLLLLAVPIPGVALDHVVYPLQLFTAEATGRILTLAGVENVVLGDMIYTPAAVFHVIEGCSGLRAMETLVMTAIVYQALLPYSRAVSWILVLTAPLIGLVINLARVLTIVTSEEPSASQDHTIQGVVMIVVGAFAVMSFGWLLEQFLERSAEPETVDRSEIGPMRPSRRRFVLLVVLLAVAGLSTFGPRWPVERPQHRSPSLLPGRIAGWHTEVGRPDRVFLGSTYYTQSLTRVYERGDVRVHVFIGVDTRAKSLLSGLSPKSHVMGSGWATLESRVLTIEGLEGVTVHESIQRSRDRTLYVLSWVQGAESVWIEALRNALAIDRSPWQRPYGATSFRIATPIDSAGVEHRVGALETIRPILDVVQATFPFPFPDPDPDPDPGPGGSREAEEAAIRRSPQVRFGSAAADSQGHRTSVFGSIATH